MKVFGALTSEPQRGIITYCVGAREKDCFGNDPHIDVPESGWYRLTGWIRISDGSAEVAFKPLYGRKWEYCCRSNEVAQFIPTPKRVGSRFRG